jgi:hypothetical protein
VRENRNGRTCVNEELMIGNRILKIDDTAQGVELPARAAKFSVKLQEALHFRAFIPYCSL